MIGVRLPKSKRAFPGKKLDTVSKMLSAIADWHHTAPAIRQPMWNVLTEIIGTAFLVFGVSAIFGPARVHIPGSGMGPYLVGILVWGIGLSLGGPTGYALNPARDLAPRFAHFLWPIPGKSNSDWGYAWVPVIGPLIGGLIGAVCWHFCF